MELERGPLLADETCTGVAWCRTHSALLDTWLAALLGRATGSGEAQGKGIAIVAVGGYGRAELCPQSDIDVMLVHDGRAEVAAVADRVWYPIWDAGLHLGHSVTTVSEALDLAADDLDTATAILSARHVAGDPELTARLASRGQAQWQKRARHWLPGLAASVVTRHEQAGEVAFRLEPDLKEGRGGLRDVHALGWSEAAHRVLLHGDLASLASSYSVLLDARVELQRRTGRTTNVLAMQEQDEVAAALGYANADMLMAQIAEAARTISWTSDDAWRRIMATVTRRTRRRADREVVLDPSLSPTSDPALSLRLAATAARKGTVIERASLERLSAEAPPLPDPWPPEARALFVELLLAGPAAVAVIEGLDQRGIWTRLLPEWRTVRARPQRNAYHRFTVDRHLLETAAIAAGLAGKVARPDLLVLTALLHDLGKGCRGDHTTAGVALARTIATRMQLSTEDVDTVASLVEHHLLLADVATRRDLDDPSTIERVVSALGSVDRLELLAALTEADSMATGPAAWGPWKAELVDRLVQRVAHVLEGGVIDDDAFESFPTAEQLTRLGQPGQHIDAHGDRLTIMTDDRQGLFSRVAGVLALHGLAVLTASVYSSEQGRALEEFRITDPVREETPWPRVIADLERALAGRLALDARVTERARTYNRNRHDAPKGSVGTVTFDNLASASATVIDIQTSDRIGVLYRITRALADLDLDIRSAKVQTLGAQVIDSFYVHDLHGHKIADRETLREIERAILHSLGP